LVLAGSCSVYDWTASHGVLSEGSPLETNLDERDGYTVAKVLQERVTRRLADENGWTLSVLRPGFIYGPGAGPAAGAGLKLGPIFLVVSPFSRLRLTHVENCAVAFVNAAEKRVAGTFNIIDDEQVSAWRYAGRLIGGKSGVLRVPVPYYAGLAMAYLASIAGRVLLPAGRRKLPGILQPRQYCARFKPFKYDTRRAEEGLAWQTQPLFATGCGVT
jgi:UDP-glucose 4-epimerase